MSVIDNGLPSGQDRLCPRGAVRSFKSVLCVSRFRFLGGYRVGNGSLSWYPREFRLSSPGPDNSSSAAQTAAVRMPQSLHNSRTSTGSWSWARAWRTVCNGAAGALGRPGVCSRTDRDRAWPDYQLQGDVISRRARDVRWSRSVGSLCAACRGWSLPSHGVPWSRARPGPGGWSGSLCVHDGPPGRPGETGAAVPAGRRSGWRRSRPRGGGGSEDRG